MTNEIPRSHPKFDQIIKAVLGFMLPLSWPAYIGLTMIGRADSRAAMMQVWYVYAIYSFIGIVLWLVLNNIPRLRAIALFGLPLLSVALIYYAVSLYAGRGESLYIGNLFYKSAGLLGNIVFVVSITALMALSEPARQIPYGTPLLIFTPYLISFLPDYSASLSNNLMLWILILAGTIGFLNLLTDLVFYLRWEFSGSGERHA
jgi:hypothetical protein